MPKRKHQEAEALGTSPTKRITRSSSALIPSLLAVLVATNLPSPKRRGHPQTTSSPSKAGLRSSRLHTKSSDASSLKENEIPENDDTDTQDDDGLLLAPENRRQSRVERKNPKRLVLEAVEIAMTKRGKANNSNARFSSTASSSNLAMPRKVDENADDAASEEESDSEVLLRKKRTQLLDRVAQPTVSLHVPLRLHLYPCLNAQKRAILSSFRDPPHAPHVGEDDNHEDSVNAVALRQLSDLLKGTTERGEGNSCLIIGPAGSGKSRIFEAAVLTCSKRPIVIRLNGHVQHNDRLAIREIARQLSVQASTEYKLSDAELADDEDVAFDSRMPPSAHLPSVVSSLSTLPRPVVVLVDAFHLFTGHARQGLLYCLFDTVQACQANHNASNGLAVVGLTSRVDVINLLEKRVKSRFSHRVLRTASLKRAEDWNNMLRQCLLVEPNFNMRSLNSPDSDVLSEWRRTWTHSVEIFLKDRLLQEALIDTIAVRRDLRVILRIFAGAVSDLSPTSPYLVASALNVHVVAQRNPPPRPLLSHQTYPALSLVIASEHSRVAGHDNFTFEMLYELFRNQVRASSAAPVFVEGGGIGMVNVGRAVLLGTFEELVQTRAFLPAANSAGLAKEFLKYRSTIARDEVKAAVERYGQTNLKKWFSKAQ